MRGTALPSAFGPRQWLMFGYATLAAAVTLQRGSYSHLAFGLALCALAATVIGVVPVHGKRKAGPLDSADVMLAVLFLLVLGMVGTAVAYEGSMFFGAVTHIVLILCGVALACAYFPRPHASARLRTAVILAVLACMTGLQLWLPFVTPNPHIDVFTVQQESVVHLFQGKNPFTTRVSNPYTGMNLNLPYDVGSRFAYPPSALVGAVVGYKLFGDVRFFYVLCNVFFVWVLRRLLRSAGPAGELLPLLWMLHPQGILFIGQSWTEPLIIAGFALTALAHHERRPWLTAIGHGLTISLKQYLVITLPLLLLLERRWKPLLLSAACILATSVPFLLWNPGALLMSMVAVIVPLRHDSLSLSVLLLMFGLHMQTWMTVCIGAGTTLSLTWLLRKSEPLHAYLAVASVSLFAMFLLGTQGFLNYYMLVSGLLLLLLVETTAKLTTRR